MTPCKRCNSEAINPGRDGRDWTSDLHLCDLCYWRAQAENDAARLDWLEVQANNQGGLLLHNGTETGRAGLGLRPGAMVRTLRQAIDSSRGVEQPG